MDGLLSGFLVDVFLFFLLVAAFAPGAELGGRIRTPGIEVEVIPNAMVSSFVLLQYYITLMQITKDNLADVS